MAAPLPQPGSLEKGGHASKNGIRTPFWYQKGKPKQTNHVTQRPCTRHPYSDTNPGRAMLWCYRLTLWRVDAGATMITKGCCHVTSCAVSAGSRMSATLAYLTSTPGVHVIGRIQYLRNRNTSPIQIAYFASRPENCSRFSVLGPTGRVHLHFAWGLLGYVSRQGHLTDSLLLPGRQRLHRLLLQESECMPPPPPKAGDDRTV